MPTPDNITGKNKQDFPYVLGGTVAEADYWMKDVGIKWYNHLTPGHSTTGHHPWLIVLVGNWRTVPFINDFLKIISSQLRPGGRIVELLED